MGTAGRLTTIFGDFRPWQNIQRTLGGYRAPRQPGDRGKKRSTLAHRAAQDARSTNAMRAR